MRLMQCPYACINRSCSGSQECICRSHHAWTDGPVSLKRLPDVVCNSSKGTAYAQICVVLMQGVPHGMHAFCCRVQGKNMHEKTHVMLGATMCIAAPGAGQAWWFRMSHMHCHNWSKHCWPTHRHESAGAPCCTCISQFST
jgi:hypothetical protein